MLERWQQNQSVQESAEFLKDLGWTPNSIVYQHNSHGFRCDEFDSRPNGLALGASVTFGEGMDVDRLWSQCLAHSTGIHVWNLGTIAAAMDTCYRILDHYLDILNPCFVVLCPPPNSRFELCAHHGRWELYGAHLGIVRHGDYVKEWLLDDRNTAINEKKNLEAMLYLCQSRHIPFVFPEPHEIMPYDGHARDLRHPGAAAHSDFARRMLVKLQDRMKGRSWK